MLMIPLPKYFVQQKDKLNFFKVNAEFDFITMRLKIKEIKTN